MISSVVFNMFDWSPIFLTVKLAAITTFLLLLFSIPIAYMLSLSRSRLKPIVEALISLPLVLPPTVLGFYFLIFWSPESLIGGFLNQYFNISLLFSFTGLVVASMIYSLPFMFQPIYNGLQSLPNSLSEAAALLGKKKWERLYLVLLPNIKNAILTACVLTFAHTIGEFGIVLMIGGNIPGETKLASIAIYEEVEAMNYETAHIYAGCLLAVSFITLLITYSFTSNNNSKAN